MREQLKTAFLDYNNGYITLKKWAIDNDLDLTDAETIIYLGRKYHNQDA